MITKSPAFEKQQSLYHNKVTLSLTLVQRLGNQACNCKVDYWVVSSCTGTQRKETLTNCVITPCMVMKTKGIPSCTGTPGQPRLLAHCVGQWETKLFSHTCFSLQKPSNWLTLLEQQGNCYSPYKLNVEKLWSTGLFPCLFFSTTHCLIVPSWCFEGRRVLL